jgi:Yip1 domain
MASNPSVPPQPPPLLPVASQPQPEVAPLSEGQRLVNTFFAPSKTFSDLRRNASWWAPFLIIAIVSLSFVYVADRKVGFRKIAENQLRAQPKQADQVEQMPADQREKNMQQRTALTKGISYGFFGVTLIWYAIVAAMLLATLKFALSAEVKFKTLFALVLYSSLPGILKAILAIVSLLAGVAGDAFTFQNPIASNPGYFVDPTTNPVLYGFLSSFDIFTFWTLALAAIGITCISKVKRGAAFAVVFGWFAVLVLIGVGFSAAFS